jgi:hypothetical protein
MTRFYRFSLLLFASLLCTCGRAQDTIYYQGFEDTDAGTLPYTTDVAPYGSGGLPTWNTVDRIKGIENASQGDRFWAARDVENALSATPVARLTFDAGDICKLTSARFVFDYNVVGYDGGDDFGYELYLDGFLHETTILVDGRNGGGRSTNGWVSDTVAIPGSAQTAKLVIFFDQNGDDVAGLDNLQLLASGTNGSCRSVCGIRLGQPTVYCREFTALDDELRINIPYTGAESGATAYLSGGTIAGDDPGVVTDGIIEVTGAREGRQYVLEVTGGDCDLELPLAFPADQCAPSNLVINEVLADPGEDTNRDGKVSPADEFVEIYNTGNVTENLSGYTLQDASNSGARFTFPQGSQLPPGERFLIYAGVGSTAPGDCNYGVASGFLGLNDDTPEAVTLRKPDGKIVAQASFDDAPDGESLVLIPDGNLQGGYHPHTTKDGSTSSACSYARAAPVDLLTFTAQPVKDGVQLDWSTANEVDNERFVVEHSKTGLHFMPVGTLPAGPGSYTFLHPYAVAGFNYYRLRQFDFDGTQTLYGPVAAEITSGAIGVYPNPTSGILNLTGEIGAGETISVFGPGGHLLHTGYGPRLDVSHLPAGSYYLRLLRSDEIYSLRFMKE